jgi:hypothetical protein
MMPQWRIVLDDEGTEKVVEARKIVLSNSGALLVVQESTIPVQFFSRWLTCERIAGAANAR